MLDRVTEQSAYIDYLLESRDYCCPSSSSSVSSSSSSSSSSSTSSSSSSSSGALTLQLTNVDFPNSAPDTSVPITLMGGVYSWYGTDPIPPPGTVYQGSNILSGPNEFIYICPGISMIGTGWCIGISLDEITDPNSLFELAYLITDVNDAPLGTYQTVSDPVYTCIVESA